MRRQRARWFGFPGLVTCLMLLAPTMPAAPAFAQDVIKTAQIDCTGDTGAAGLGAAAGVTVDIDARDGVCPAMGAGSFCSAATPLLAIGEICGTGGPGVGVMPTVNPLLNAACPTKIAMNVAGPGGAGASIIIQNTAGNFDLFEVCVNGVLVVLGPPGVVDIDPSADVMNVQTGGKLKTPVPALSAQGVVVFLMLVSGALVMIWRRRSGRINV